MELYDKIQKEKKKVLKVIVLGDVNVGKSNIIRRIIGQEFQELEATVGVEYTYKDMKNMDPNDPDLVLSIQIWDTSGAERYRAITTNHIRGADGCFLVYDISNSDSFKNIDFWLEIVKKANDQNIVIYLLGNKADLPNEDAHKRKVEKNEAIRYCHKEKFNGFGECSALKNVNIEAVFQSLCKTLYKKNKDLLDQKNQDKIVQLNKMVITQRKSKDCCT